MSFSTIIKDEVTKINCTKAEYIAELSSIIRNSAIYDNDIVVTVENNSVARRVFKLLKDLYDVNIIEYLFKKV